MSATELPNAARPTKGARWGGAVRVECPHCHVTRPKNHQPFCKQNPKAKVRIPPAAAIHIAARQVQESQPPMPAAPPPQPEAPAPVTASPPVEPAPVVAAPVAAVAAAPREVPIPLREIGAQQAVDADAFVKARVAELQQQAQPVQRITPRATQVDSRPRIVSFTPSPLLIKLGIGAAVGLGAFWLWRNWRNNNVHEAAAKQQAAGKRKLVFAKKQPAVEEPQRYTGPRAWTPEPERVSDDVVPGSASIGGGYVPSPQTQWSQHQEDVLRGRAGRP